MKRHAIAFALTVIALLLSVMMVQWAKQLLAGGEVALDAAYSRKIMIAGAIADSLRALLMTLLYTQLRHHDRSYTDAILFGMLTCFLAGSLWVLYQYLATDTLSCYFLVEETIILLLQGLLSGVALGAVYVTGGKCYC